MAGKDIAEKILESYNDVFSDIVNVLLFKGKTVVHPNELTERNAREFYKADDTVRELERDVAKWWMNDKISIACIGLENQSTVDNYMPLRVIGYDGAEYRFQLTSDNTCAELYPVITLVLYFGFEHWNKPKRLMECVDIPEILAPYVNDYRINLFEIAWLTPEDVKLFKSDFRYVADYFVQMRMTGEYLPQDDGGSIEHVQELFHALGVFTGDHRFEEVLARKNGEVSMTMVSGLDTYFELRYEQKFAEEKLQWAEEKKHWAEEKKQLADEHKQLAEEQQHSLEENEKMALRIAELEKEVERLKHAVK